MTVHRVLLVEDDPRLATMVADYLGEAGFRTTRAGTGAAAMQLVASESFDAMILDLMLPYVSGYQVLIEARQNPRWQHVPIVVVTVIVFVHSASCGSREMSPMALHVTRTRWGVL